MAKDGVDYKDLYLALESFRQEMNGRFDRMENAFGTFHKEEFEPLVRWQSDFTGKTTVLIGILTLSLNFVWDLLFRKLFEGK